jgi:hypothetical protein
MVRALAILLAHLMAAPVVSETVEIRGRGEVDLASFECRDINRSTILQRVCYDRTQKDLIVAVRGSYDRSCAVPGNVVERLMGAPSMGQFFNHHISRPASGERYACPPQGPGR